MAGSVSGDSARARKARRRRVQGAALSGGALVAGQLAGAAPAQAATITVNTLSDVTAVDGLTTLREAIAQSNLLPAQTDTINFDASLTGTIQLVGQLHISDDVTITGPGAATITVDAQDDSLVFGVYNFADDIVVTISGLTVTGGAGFGGIAVFADTLTLDDMVITANRRGVYASTAVLVITDSTISENTGAGSGRGGGVSSKDTPLTISGTQFLHNTAPPGPGGGGLAAVGGEGPVLITGSTFDDNQARFGAGILLEAHDVSVSIVASTLTGNDAALFGGGLAMDVRNNDAADVVTITESTISGNTAAYGGGGILFYGPYDASSRLQVDRSTISGNDGGEGGGVQITNGFDPYGNYDVTHSVTISDSTISGNDAVGHVGESLDGAGGGVFVALSDGDDTYGGVDTLAVTLANSTIADNSAATLGGGLLEAGGGDAFINLDHTIVGNNAAGVFSPDVFGFVIANWSLVENTDGFSPTGANNITGQDPALAPLADNGGPTFTHMIAPTSPAHDAGNPAFAIPPGPTVDQRGRPRISGTRIDIGAVERQTSLPAVVNSSVNWRLRDRLSTGPANLPTFTMGTTPLVPLIGDWDGDGDKTPGFVKGGVFTLSNNLAGTGPFVTFAFGDNRGFPVAGNWDGDLDDEVAVFRNGTWQVRKTTTPGDPTLFTPNFVFGTGGWPTTTPVAGDWDGNGTDGIGFYLGNGPGGVGTWSLRQTATGGPTEVGPFAYEPSFPAAGYPVVGDWDGDGYDTFGTKAGLTWTVSNTHAPTAPVTAFSFDFSTATPAQDLPVVWRLFPGP